MVGEIIAVILVFAVAVGLGIWYKSSLLSKGKIIARQKDFAEYAEIFTLRPLTDEQFIAAVRAAQFKQSARAEVTGNAGAITFSVGRYYSAALRHTEQTEEKSVYRFEFTQWKSSGGSPSFSNEMNMLLTAVEKMFIALDPAAQVSTVKNDIKTKRSFI